MTYEQAKKIWEANRQTVFLCGCFVLVFLAGFGAGRYEKKLNVRKYQQSNYTKNQVQTQSPNVQVVTPETVGEGVKGVSTTTSASPVKTTDCYIKGNISTGGKKIYHIPGGASYKTVKPEMCFYTESEAVAAGFVKSGR
ncbi:MAG: hypothetical protein JNN11_04845 [Candidatus Doudnabacteria bacterium]|nr:hypothetical protein [Candidatus Doudnabacteria bacterium]